MGFISSLIFEKKFLTKLVASSEVASDLAEIQIDASINIDHQMSSMVTSNPIEDGSTVSDGAVRENRKVTLKGMIVNHPLIDFNFFGILSISDQDGRAQSGFEVLKKVWKQSQPFSLETKIETYDPVIITDLVVIDNVAVGDAIKFSMTVEEVNIVQSSTVEVPVSKVADTVQGAASLVDKGKQVAKTASAAVQDKSLLISIIGALR